MLLKKHSLTYIFKSVLTELRMKVKETNGWKPRSPENNTFHTLHINDAKYEDELVEDKVPKLVLDVLKFRYTELTKYLLLQPIAKENQ